jgi:GNAT superfamily N-acetyltransferase
MIRPARPADVPSLLECIRGLARYERLEHQLDLDGGRLREHLFGPRPACAALVAEQDGAVVGFALYFATYSTFRTRPCLFLEDLFVQPDQRGCGHGLALLAAVAAEAVARGCPRLDWNVLDWNESAIDFYRRQGAELLPDWRTCRLQGEALQALARSLIPDGVGCALRPRPPVR